MSAPANAAAPQIKAFVERLEQLDADRKIIEGDVAEVYAEAKAAGFDRKALKALVLRRSKDRAQAGEQEALVDLYEAALDGGAG